MKKLLPTLLALALSVGAAFAQGGPGGGGGPGPGPVPSPWIVSGPQISYGGCVLERPAMRRSRAALLLSCALIAVGPSRAQIFSPPIGAITSPGGAPIGTPVSLGSNTATGGTTLAITTTGNAPSGSVIHVGCIANGSFTSFAVADGTNSYTNAVNQGNNVYISNTGILGAQLNSGSTITITSGTTLADAFCGASYVTGLSTATRDKTVAGATNSVTTAALTQANEIAFGAALAFNGGVNPGAISMTSGFTILSSATNYGGDKFSAAFAYKIVAATTAVTFSWSATTTVANSAAATYNGN